MTYFSKYRRLYFPNLSEIGCPSLRWKSQAGREGTLDSKLHWYPKFYNRVGYKYFGYTYWLVIGWFDTRNVQTFQPISLICKKSNSVHGCILICHILSYPLTSLVKNPVFYLPPLFPFLNIPHFLFKYKNDFFVKKQ